MSSFSTSTISSSDNIKSDLRDSLCYQQLIEIGINSEVVEMWMTHAPAGIPEKEMSQVLFNYWIRDLLLDDHVDLELEEDTTNNAEDTTNNAEDSNEGEHKSSSDAAAADMSVPPSNDLHSIDDIANLLQNGATAGFVSILMTRVQMSAAIGAINAELVKDLGNPILINQMESILTTMTTLHRINAVEGIESAVGYPAESLQEAVILLTRMYNHW